MAPTKTATKSTQKSAKRTSANSKTPKGFTDEEKAAMRERARELKAEAAKADGETELLAAIAKMQEPDRAMAKKLQSLIKAAAPALAPKTWYGMPAYAKDGNVICFLPKRREVQSQIPDARLQRQGETRRRRHVADLVCAHEIDCRRRGKDHSAREKSGALEESATVKEGLFALMKVVVLNHVSANEKAREARRG
jgi:hypothetical protein